MKGLMLFYGQAARIGRGYTQKYSLDSLLKQEMAITTHLDFFDYVKEKFDIVLDKILITYDSEISRDIKKRYQCLEGYNYFLPSNRPDRRLIFDATETRVITLLKDPEFISQYQFIFLVRIDIAFKKYFFTLFNPFEEKIKLTFMVPHWGTFNVCDLMFFIPKNLFNKINCFYPFHNFHEKITNQFDGVIKQTDLDFYIKTTHRANSKGNSNPLYWVCGREESKESNFVKYKSFILEDLNRARALKLPVKDTIEEYDPSIYPKDLTEDYKKEIENRVNSNNSIIEYYKNFMSNAIKN